MTALLLLPGMDGTGQLFAPLLQHLPSEVEPIVVRYADRPQGYDDHVRAARREIPRDRPFVILGESFSGPVAVTIGEDPPPNLRGIILCASFITCPSSLLRLLGPLASIASPRAVPGFLAHYALMGRFATHRLKVAHARALREASSATLTARLRAMADLDLRETMRRIELPSLYLRATADRIVAARFGDEYLACARHGRIHEVDAPHFLLQTRPAESARVIARFMANPGDRMSSSPANR